MAGMGIKKPYKYTVKSNKQFLKGARTNEDSTIGG